MANLRRGYECIFILLPQPGIPHRYGDRAGFGVDVITIILRYAGFCMTGVATALSDYVITETVFLAGSLYLIKRKEQARLGRRMNSLPPHAPGRDGRIGPAGGGIRRPLVFLREFHLRDSDAGTNCVYVKPW